MAVVAGTAFVDTIHRLGDGVTINGNEVTGVTTGADQITGNNGNDFIYGDGGIDTVDGGEGDDTIFGGQAADVLNGGIGNDTFRFLAISEIGGLNEKIDGGVDIDTLDFSGLSGAIDIRLAEFTSVERLFSAGMTVTLTASQLGAFTTLQGNGAVDVLILSGAGTTDLTGATINNIEEFRGSTGADVIAFTNASELVRVNTLAGADKVFGTELGDIIDGGSESDELNGQGGSDILLGGTGADTLNGGNGNDSFRIAFISEISGLAETINGGGDIDRIDFQALGAGGAVNLSSATITDVEELALFGNDVTLKGSQLGAFTNLIGSGAFDRLILSGLGTADLTDATINNIDEIRGSSGGDFILLTNVLTGQFVDGRAGSDTIRGGFGADTIWGDIGADTIYGGDGGDIIRGGQDADNLNGDVGNDVFQIQQVSDISGLAEKVNGGNDIDRLDFSALGATGAVNLTAASLTSVEHLAILANDVTLRSAQLANFEIISGSGAVDRLFLSDAGTVDLTNASISNIDEIRGTSGNNTIDLTGVATGQTVNGGFGIDTIRGSDGNDIINGEEGADRLIGRKGNDIVTGGEGADDFFFNTTLNASTNVDTITDFTVLDDTIQLASATFGLPVGTLSAAAFAINTTGTATTAAHRIVYESDTGNLFYDSNGNVAGGSTLFAVIGTNLALTNADFVVF